MPDVDAVRTPAATPPPVPISLQTPLPAREPDIVPTPEPGPLVPEPTPPPAPAASPAPLPGAATIEPGPGRGAARARAAARPTTASFSPPEVRLLVGGTATVGIVIMGVQDLTSVALALTYDPAVVEAVDISGGSLLTLDGQAVGAERGLESGRVRARFQRTTGTAGSGVVASVTFRGLKAGSSILRVENLNLTTGGRSATPVVTPARITVSQ